MPTKIRSRGASLLALMMLANAAAHAADIACTGMVTFVGIDGAGNVIAQLGGMLQGQGTQVHRICSITPPSNVGVRPDFPSMTQESCKVAHATLLASKMNGKPAQIYYHGLAGCESIGYWTSTDAYFVGSP